MRPLGLLTAFVLCCWACGHRKVPLDPLVQILKEAPRRLQNVIDSAAYYEVQILYTQIERGEHQYPHLHSFYFNRDDDKYFYPASTVKMPVAFLALEYLNNLATTRDVGLDRNSRLVYSVGMPPQTAMTVDTVVAPGYPTVASFIEKIFAVSDNESYNRLYELLGQDYINERMQEKGIFTNSRIVTRVGVSGYDAEANRYTNPVTFSTPDGQSVYQQDQQYALYQNYPDLSYTAKGIGYYDEVVDSVVMVPFDMSEKNFINLTDLQACLEHLIFPMAVEPEERYDLTNDQYEYLYRTMSKLPGDYPEYQSDPDQYYDSYVKFFLFGDTREPIPDHIKIFSKVGWAYGTLTESAYILDHKAGIEFFLSATILVNKNQVFNDGHYEYETIGLPFLASLGREVYRYEINRQRRVKPDFTALGW